MYKIDIVDDERSACTRLENMILKYGEKHGKEFEIRKFNDPKIYLGEKINADIIFLDVDMSGMNGIELAEKIRESRYDVIIIFCTNLQQFAIEGYKVNAFGFIVKPVSEYNFKFYFDKALDRLESDRESNEKMNLKIVGGVKTVQIQNIYYVEVKLHNLYYHVKVRGDNGDLQEAVIRDRGILRECEEKLKGFDFARCGISFLVNLSYVTAIEGNAVYLPIGELPLTRKYKKEFMDAYMCFLMKRKEVILK